MTVLSPEQREEMRDAPAIRMKERNGVQLHLAFFRMLIPGTRSAHEGPQIFCA